MEPSCIGYSRDCSIALVPSGQESDSVCMLERPGDGSDMSGEYVRTTNIESDGEMWLGNSHSTDASQDASLAKRCDDSGRVGSDNGGSDSRNGVGGKGLSFPVCDLDGVARMKD